MVHGNSTSPEAHRRSIEDTSPRTSRKVSTYGGSRAWSEEEEAYLLEARQCKTPYKHIAAHLQKTELACRLHFHQLAYGTKRKRRSPSTSSATTNQGSRNPSVQATERGHASQRSIDSTNSRASIETTPQTKLNAPAMRVSTFSPPTSPPPAQRRRLARSESPPHHDDSLRVPATSTQAATSTIPAGSTFSPFPAQSPFPALPHLHSGISHPPNSPSTFSYTSVPSCAPHSSGSQSQSLYPHHPADLATPVIPAPRLRPHSYSHSQISSEPKQTPHYRHSHLIEINNSNFAGQSQLPGSAHPHSPSIDPYRLSGIYGRNKNAFWISIAREYGGNVSPSALEAAFLRQSAGSPTGSLPTPPNRSPILALSAPVESAEKVHGEGPQRARSEGDERRGSRESEGRDGGAGCSIASLLTDDQDVWQRRRAS